MNQYNFPSQTAFYSGKVRDVYTIRDQYLVMVASNRISAFDVHLQQKRLQAMMRTSAKQKLLHRGLLQKKNGKYSKNTLSLYLKEVSQLLQNKGSSWLIPSMNLENLAIR